MIAYPLNDVVKQADAAIERGGQAFQQCICERCLTKLTLDVPNTFYTSVSCEQCGHTTDIEKVGCNLMLVYRTKELDS